MGLVSKLLQEIKRTTVSLIDVEVKQSFIFIQTPEGFISPWKFWIIKGCGFMFLNFIRMRGIYGNIR